MVFWTGTIWSCRTRKSILVVTIAIETSEYTLGWQDKGTVLKVGGQELIDTTKQNDAAG